MKIDERVFEEWINQFVFLRSGKIKQMREWAICDENFQKEVVADKNSAVKILELKEKLVDAVLRVSYSDGAAVTIRSVLDKIADDNMKIDEVLK